VKKLEPLYTVSETAKILNVSEKTVRRLIKDEVLRAIDFRREDDRRGAVRIAEAISCFLRSGRLLACSVASRFARLAANVHSVRDILRYDMTCLVMTGDYPSTISLLPRYVKLPS